jgi:hypothetical protein
MSRPRMKSLVISETKTQILSGRRRRVRIRQLFQDGEGFPRYRLQPSGGDVWPCYNSVRSGIYDHQARFVTNLTLRDQTRICIFIDDGQSVTNGF